MKEKKTVINKLIPTKEEIREGWDAPFHVMATIGVLVLHLVMSFSILLLLNFVGIIIFNEPLWGTSSNIILYIVTLVIMLFLQLLFYNRMYDQEFYQYCKSLLIVTPLFWGIMMTVYFMFLK